MSYQDTKRHGVSLTALLLTERSQSEKTVFYMAPTLWDFGEDKAIDVVKINKQMKAVVTRGQGEVEGQG